MTELDFHTEDIHWKDIGEHQDDNSIYRGHRCATWKLESSLERACNDVMNPSKQRQRWSKFCYASLDGGTIIIPTRSPNPMRG